MGIEHIFLTHIRETAAFPKKQADLEVSNILRMTISDGKPVYYMRSTDFDPSEPNNPRGWKKCRYGIEKYKIAYGANLDELSLVSNKLYDKNGQQYLLIDDKDSSIFTRPLKSRHERTSMKWFEEYKKCRSNIGE